MAKERTVRPMSGFFKFTTIGQSVAGKIEKYNPGGENGPFVVIAPALVATGGKVHQWASVAVGLSTDLRLKVSPSDEGSFMGFRFKETEPTTKGSKKKIFSVVEYDSAEIRELAATADKTHRNDPYKDENAPAASNAAGTHGAEDDEDDLPF